MRQFRYAVSLRTLQPSPELNNCHSVVLGKHLKGIIRGDFSKFDRVTSEFLLQIGIRFEQHFKYGEQASTELIFTDLTVLIKIVPVFECEARDQFFREI